MRRRSGVRGCAALVCLVATSVLASCSVGGSDDGNDDTPLRIGLLIPQSGTNQTYGAEIQQGFQLYLDTHDGALGGRSVELIVADEGDGKQTSVDSATRLIEQDGIDVLVGTTVADSLSSIENLLAENATPFIGTGARPSAIGDISNVWYTSWLTREPGTALAEYLRTTISGSVYVLGPDRQSGWEQLAGFTETYIAAGGKIANDGGKATGTPSATTTNFLPYINKISSSGAKAVYAAYSGAEAVAFVQQYAKSGLGDKIPLYGPASLTDEVILSTQAEAADGVQTVGDYAADLDDLANREFVVAFQKAYGTSPHIFNVTSYDAAWIVDQAVEAAGDDQTPDSINVAMGAIGQIDSPRGLWRWSSDHTPVQNWYLRTVGVDGRMRANVLVQTLTTLGASQ